MKMFLVVNQLYRHLYPETTRFIDYFREDGIYVREYFHFLNGKATTTFRVESGW